jgi:hypothetical protein
MTNAQIQAITAAVIAALSVTKTPAKQHKKLSSYKPANRFQNVKAKADKVLSDGKTERQISNDVAVAKAFKKLGFTVVPRVDALTYKGWLLKGMRVQSGQHGTFVKGVGTLFHSGQVSPDLVMSKPAMMAEVAALTQAVA